MATHQRQAAQPGTEQLPDELLICIMSKLDLRNRHRAALVSRRWHACAHAPELCRRMNVELPARWDGLPCHAALASFAAWLLRHGRHLCRLRLRPECMAWDELEEVEEQVQLACCLMACAGSPLEVLAVRDAQVVAAWVPAALGSLQQLDIQTTGELCISSSLGSLTRLTRLVLVGSPTRFGRGTRLPPSIQQLSWTDLMTDDLPEQLTDLPRLSDMSIGGNLLPGGGYSRLTRLSALTRLQLSGNSHVPSSLGQLTWLKALALDHSFTNEAQPAEEAGAALDEALQSLTRLTSLLAAHISAPQGLPALAGLAHLQRACLMRCPELGSLPAGAWCGSLRELAADWDCLARSTAFLAEAEQLQQVAVWANWNSQPLGPALRQWATCHPPLQHLEILREQKTSSTPSIQAQYDQLDSQSTAELVSALVRLRQERPGLRITCGCWQAQLALEGSFKLKMGVEL